MKKNNLFILLSFLLLSIQHLSAQDSVKLVSRKVGNVITSETENYKNYRFTIGGGYANWLGENSGGGSQTLNDFTSDLKHGYNLDISWQYFF